MRTTLTLSLLALCAVVTAPISAQNQAMTFFVSSTGSGMGGNLGGLAGADKHCQALAAKAGAGNRNGRPISAPACRTSTRATGLARDPGRTPRASSSPPTSMSCTRTRPTSTTTPRSTSRAGRSTAGCAQPARHHDRVHARREGDDDDLPELDEQRGHQTGMLGHHDWLKFGKPGSPWNSAHASKGCSQENLVATGGAGLIYCFAAN